MCVCVYVVFKCVASVFDLCVCLCVREMKMWREREYVRGLYQWHVCVTIC